MKFIISSSVLLGHLNFANQAISYKSTILITEGILFSVEDNTLKITSTDMETTLISEVFLQDAHEEGKVVIPANILLNSLKGFKEDTTLTFYIDKNTISISYNNGEFIITGFSPDEFPSFVDFKDFIAGIDSEVLRKGLETTLFAVADDPLRPVLNGVLIEAGDEGINFAATDAHKLAVFSYPDGYTSNEGTRFVLPRKPATIIKNLRPKGMVEVGVGEKGASFYLGGVEVHCRLVDGTYPDYTSVIPKDNPNKLKVERQPLIQALKRVLLYSKASNVVKLDLAKHKVKLSAENDLDNISAFEVLVCDYEGEEMQIGFNGKFLIEILSHLRTKEVTILMSDPNRAALILPKDEGTTMLLMPMMIME